MLLAIDTSTSQVGLALYDGERVLGEVTWASRAHHTEQVSPALAELLARSEVKMTEVQALGVAIGPGSFTSLRVGLSLMKGIALARHIPLIGIPSLDIAAAAQPLLDLPLAAVLQAGRGRLAVGWYSASEAGWQAEGPATVSTVEQLSRKIKSPTIVCGEMTGDERRLLARKRINVRLAAPANCIRRPALLAELAWNRWQAGGSDDPASLAPIYLHIANPIPNA
jgi:tRNA threonylcarbamoyladenosine biosynthesis protein TsaB